MKNLHLLEKKNTGPNVHELGFCNEFLDMILKIDARKEKKWINDTLSELKAFVH